MRLSKNEKEQCLRYFNDEKYVECAIFVYVLLQKHGDEFLKQLLCILQNRIYLEKSRCKKVNLFCEDDIQIKNHLRSNDNLKNILCDDCVQDIRLSWVFEKQLEFFEINICSEFIVQTDAVEIFKSECYQDQLKKFKLHCVEISNYALIEYFIQKELLFYVKYVKEWRFLYEIIVLNMNLKVNLRIFSYFLNYNENMRIDGLTKMFK